MKAEKLAKKHSVFMNATEGTALPADLAWLYLKKDNPLCFILDETDSGDEVVEVDPVYFYTVIEEPYQVEGKHEHYFIVSSGAEALSLGEIEHRIKKIERFLDQNYIIMGGGSAAAARSVIQSIENSDSETVT